MDESRDSAEPRWAMGSAAKEMARAGKVPVLITQSFRSTPQKMVEPATERVRRHAVSPLLLVRMMGFPED